MKQVFILNLNNYFRKNFEISFDAGYDVGHCTLYRL